MVRPRRVTEALVRAVYAARLREFEEGSRAAAAVERFRAEIFNRFRDLYRTRETFPGTKSTLAFSWRRQYPRHRIQRSHSQYLRPILTIRRTANIFQHSLELIPLAPAPTQLSPLESARTAFAEADVDRAYELAIELPPSFDRCALLLRCARDMGTLAAAQVALDSLDTLPNQDRVRLDQHIVLSRIRDGLSD